MLQRIERMLKIFNKKQMKKSFHTSCVCSFVTTMMCVWTQPHNDHITKSCGRPDYTTTYLSRWAWLSLREYYVLSAHRHYWRIPTNSR